MAAPGLGGWLLSPDPLLKDTLDLWASRALAAGQHLGVFTELGRGPRTAARLADRLGLAHDAARDLLDALLALGWLQREGDDAQAVYVSTRTAAHFLDPRSSAFLGDLLLAARTPWAGPADAALDDALRAMPPAPPPPPAWQDALVRMRARLGTLHAQALAQALAHDGATASDPEVLSLLLQPGDEAGWRITLAGAAQALRPGARLVVIDYIADDARRQHVPALVFGLAGRMTGQGRGALTEADVRQACRTAGLADDRCLPLPGGASALVAQRPA